MNTITKNTQIVSIAFATLFVIAFSFAAAPKAHATDEGYDVIGSSYDLGGDYGGLSGDGGYSYGADYGSLSGTGDYSYGDYGSLSGTGDYSYTPDYGGGYTPSYGSSGYTSGGSYYSTGFGGGFYMPTSSTMPGISNSNTNVNTNTCTGNSCNTVYDDHSVFNAPTTVTIAGQSQSYPVYVPQYTQPPVVYNQPPVYNTCNTCGCQGYQPCYRPTQQQPYVTLAAVPYTGLELGTTGTIAYWGFLVLWCLLAAYLIAVKKVQNRIAAWFTGTKAATSRTVVSHAPITYSAPVAKVAEPQYAGIDPFIASQIARTN